jgi:hypothetical protein
LRKFLSHRELNDLYTENQVLDLRIETERIIQGLME